MDELISERMDILIKEYREQRDALKLMILDLDKIKEKIEKLFPESLDKRYIMFFEQKVKTATGIFSAILDIRKEISKNIKDEMEMLRRMPGDGSNDLTDISELADQIEKHQKDSLKLIEGGLECQMKLEKVM
jgi:hypothetical protein